ncbi:hypothetical protein ACOSQ2_005270 [Xanthoceras sorbifolium]
MVNNRKDEASRSAVNSPSNTPTSNQAQLAALEADRVEIHEGQAELRREMAQLIDRVDRIERKKNALLRIQKPFFRNKDDEESHYSGYFDEMNSSSYRDNDQFLYLDGVHEKQERKGSLWRLMCFSNPIRRWPM